MQNQEKIEDKENNLNINDNNFQYNKFGLDDELIEKNDNIIDNQFDMIKNIQKSQIENLNYNINKKEYNNNTNNINNNINTNNEVKEEKKEEEIDTNLDNNNNNNNIENEIIENKETNEEEKYININSNSNNINTENQNIITESKNDKETSSKNEIFQRLANFLDSEVEKQEKIIESPKKEEIQTYTENEITTKEINENILTKDNTENRGLNLELKEAKKTIETMSSVIDDLKLQLKSKDDFLNKALLSQKNENDLLLQRQNTLMESLISEKRNMEMQISELQSKLSESEKTN